jgi:hypothetical protein
MCIARGSGDSSVINRRRRSSLKGSVLRLVALAGAVGIVIA